MASSRPRRRNCDWDYKELNRSGKKIPIFRDPPTKPNMSDDDAEKKINADPQMDEKTDEVKASVANEMSQQNLDYIVNNEEDCYDEICTFFEENKVKEAISLDEIDSSVAEIKDLRRVFKRAHRELKSKLSDYDRLYKMKNDKCCTEITEYIKKAKEEKKKRIDDKDKEQARKAKDEEKIQKDIKETADKKKKLQEKRIIEIKEKEIAEKISHIKTLCKAADKVEDDEILELKSNLADLDKELRDLRDMRDKFESFISEFGDKETIIARLANEYKAINESVVKYKETLKSEIKKRELEDYKLKAIDKLNIDIPKFSGTDHKIDIYSFQTKFEEEHVRLPKNKCLYQLKEKFLTGPAKEMVKLVEDIDEIWKILKEAFGDPKVLLSYELACVKKLGPLSRIKENQELALALAKLANAMENLSKTAEKHNIKHELYNSHTEAVIYKILGDERVDKFLEKNGSGTSAADEWVLLKDFVREESKRKSRMALKLNPTDIPPTKKDDKKGGYAAVPQDPGGNDLKKETPPSCMSCGNKENETVIKKLIMGVLKDSMPQGGTYVATPNNKCKACGGSECENKGDEGFEYVKCKEFRKLTCNERLERMKKVKVCFQCLQSHPFRAECENDFVCKNEWHKKFNKGFHVLVCQEHEQEEENKKLLEKYKVKIFKNKENFPQSFVVIPPVYKVGGDTTRHQFEGNEEQKDTTRHQSEEEEEQKDLATFMLQRIKVKDKDGKDKFINLFYDSGCSESNCRKEATTKLGDRAREITPGPLHLFGVGNSIVTAEHGEWEVSLPLADGGEAKISGLCLDQLTHKLPEYRLDGEVKTDILDYCRQIDVDESELPKFPMTAGGDTDIMIGSQYRKYFPVEVVRLPSGLSLCESKFIGADGTRGVICGPHPSFTRLEQQLTSQYARKVYSSYRLHEVQLGNSLRPSGSMLGFKANEDVVREMYFGDQSYQEKTLKALKVHEAVENAGTVSDYRCIDCRGCTKCKQGERIDKVSLKEEYEQEVINKSVEVDVGKCVATARLPILEEKPEKILTPNGNDCLQVFKSIVRQLDKDTKSKEEIVEFENKLQKLGFVDKVDNLTAEQQKNLKENPVQNFIPWHCVWSKNSISTPGRMVFNGSFSVRGKRTLNSLLPKGMNNINSLQEIMIRWFTHPVAYHADIRKMYNTILLHPSDWCYQRYWWKEDLDNDKPLVEKVVKTIIYGMKCSGNQAGRALTLLADKMKEIYPKAAEIVKKETYVDDNMGGDATIEKAKETTDDMKKLLRHGNFKFKGVVFSGEDPPDDLTEDGESVKVAGLKWLSKKDLIQLCVGEFSFEKKKHGKSSMANIGKIPEKFTRKQCASKVAEVFDLTGKVAPIVAGFKLDLRMLIQRKLQWDDTIPNDLREMWVSNFEMIQEIPEITFRRCVIPEDAVSTDIETLDFGDSSGSLICAAIYARIKRTNGKYACQLLFARTKLLPEGITIPRGELAAAELNATTGFVVKKALGEYHKGYWKFTDSQVALFWVNSREKPLRPWVRTKVIEVNRLSEALRWFGIPGAENVADIGTRKGTTPKDLHPESRWMVATEWAKEEESKFPMISVEGISLKNIREEINAEMHKYAPILEAMEVLYTEPVRKVAPLTNVTTRNIVPKEVSERYKFCKYLIDPNKFSLKKITRIMGCVQRFIKNLKRAVRRRKDLPDIQKEGRKCLKVIPDGLNETNEEDAIIFSDDEVMTALEYFYKKATLEIKEYRGKKDYQHIAEEVDGIMYYKGRVLLEQEVTGVKDMCDVMVDLSCRTFWVPLVDRFSPFAYSIVNEVHWQSKEAKHTGVEKTLRYTLQYAHILEGRDLVTKVRKSCLKCRALMREQLKVVMGPVSSYNLNIAPAFYVTQVDLFGPLQSYHGANKRTKMKIWGIVFCCATTGAVDIKVMESYTSSSFILGFKRFSSRAGFPKVMLPDQGSQLLKACGDVELKFNDVKGKLNREYGIEFNACPVGAHYMHGRVERKIRQVRECLARSLDGHKLSVLEWETVFAEIANSINNLPLGLINRPVEVGNLDLLTPNRLLMGRNNDRSPVEPVDVSGSHDRIIQANNDIFQIWFKCWLTEYVPTLMTQQKWFDNDRELEVGDIVMFKKAEKEVECQYRYGVVQKLKHGQDGVARSATVEYQNPEEGSKRTTQRGIRELILIHHVDEIGIMHELSDAAREESEGESSELVEG